MKCRELKKIVASCEDDWKSFIDETYEYSEKQVGGLTFRKLHEGRDSGSGDYDGWLIRFECEGRFYELNGTYSSWDGFNIYDYYDFVEVEAYQELVTFYREIKDAN